MKTRRFIYFLLFLSCSTPKVVYDYDSKIEFSKYKTYSFFEDVGAGFNNLDVNRSLSIIEKQMEVLGFKKAETPDFYINFSGKREETAPKEQVSVGFGNRGANIGIGIDVGSKKVLERFTLDIIDHKTDQLIWQGVSSSNIKEQYTPDQRVLYLEISIKKILSKFPPK